MTGTNLTIVAGVQEQHPSALKEENKDNNKQHEFSSSSGSIKSTVEEEEDDDDGRRNDDDLSGIISTSGFSSDDDGEEESEENALRNRIIRREEKAVRNSRWILIAAILIATVCTCVAVHAFAANGDKHAFELEYEGYVTDIINLVQWEVQYNFALMQQLSAAVTNTALVSGAVFPYWTDPNFEVIGGYADGMGGIMLAGFAPLVSATERQQWEQYAYENQGWLERSKRLKISHPGHRDALHGTIQDHEHDRRRRHRSLQQQEQQQGLGDNEKSNNNNFTDMDFYSNAIHRRIYRWENGTRVPEEATSPEDNDTIFYAPLWQLSPADAGAVNVNLLSDDRIRALYDAMIIANHSVISPGLPIADLFDFQFDASEKHYKADPHGFLLEPVYDNFGDSSPPTMVGFLIGLTSYRNLVTRLVPEGAAPGIVAVFRDSCGNDLTFSLHGHNATFMGYNDAHDEHFDQYRRSTVVELYNMTFGTNETAVPGLCVHQLHIYPTSTFRAAYNTNKPVVYTAVVALAFMLTSVVLLVYDRMVTKRQDKTMQSAVASNKVVSNLFPETVRERLLVQSGNNNNNHHHHKDHNVNSKKHQHQQQQRGGRFGRGKQQQQQHSEDECGSEELLLHRSHSAVALASAAASSSSTGQYGNNNNFNGSGCCLSYKTRPIAEFYPNTTIMFADIVGFTAWSSTREPFQVFLLLETIFSEFDAIAKRRRVFKVETVGDCYVAVCGLPTPRTDHAAVMARFATDIRHKMKDLTQRLEVALGPDTNELTFRIGLHSGPITGGVLRGNNARYQLFGDAINTAARMESTCLPNRIQVSSETAELLIAAKKAHWITARENKVHAKGKGELDTYWLILGESHCPPATTQAAVAATTTAAAAAASSSGVRTKPALLVNDNNSAPHDVHNSAVVRKNSVGGGAGGDIDVEPVESAAALSMKDMRLVDWNTTILLERIKAIVLHRQKQQQRQIKSSSSSMMMVGGGNANANDNGTVAVEIPLDVMSQLHGFCTGIATMYNKNNPFHNFEHASHVTMSTTKLLARVVRWDDNNNVTTTDGGGGRSRPSSHQPQQPQQQNGCDNAYTRGITSDPLTQFAVIFSALIHDVDHSGVPNATLVAEKAPLAAAYKNKSVAENNSISVAWEFLMQEQFRDLVAFICPTKKDLDRLGELVVNIVLATDIADKELKAARNQRWEKVFFSSPGDEDEHEGEQRATPQDDDDSDSKAIDRMKATIVIEHLIQASDVCHTMQHWHVFRKWNERLFCEMYAAYVAGRAEKNPADFWYEGEIGFFDYYIIPLAKKLDECRVFGVSSDELLNYAQRNRREWEQKGKEVVEMYKEKYCVQAACAGDGGASNNEQQ